MSQGANANHEGRENREDVLSILLRHGFEPVKVGTKQGWEACLELIKEMDAPRLTPQPAGVFASEVVMGESVYGSEIREDFLLYCPKWPRPMAVACRHQGTSGSAKEKIEYLFANIAERFPCPCCVILEGSELLPVYRRALEWVERSKGQLASAFSSVQDFRRWVSDGCPYPAPPQTLGV